MNELGPKYNFLSERKIDLILLTVILICSYFIFVPVLKNNFLTYDDGQWMSQNALLSSQNIHTYFTTATLNMYSPLTRISFAVDHLLGGIDPYFYHLSNLILHLLNIILVYSLIKTISGKTNSAFIAAFLFALHPAAADTVAWVSTRSNLLYTFFFLSSLLCYCQYVKGNKKLLLGSLCFVLFILSCLSKSAAVILPFILLTIDHFTGRKFSMKIILEKLPFLFISIIIGLLAIHFRGDLDVSRSVSEYNLLDKFFMISYSYSHYLVKLILPLGLSAVYTYPAKANGMLPWIYYISILLFPVVLIVLWKIRNTKKKIVFGVLFFLLALAPALIGFFEDGFIANRYTYLPYVGLFFLIGYFIERFPKQKIILFSGIAIILFYFGYSSYQRTFVWKNDITLFTDAIQKQNDNAFAYNSRGVSNYYLNDLDAALADYSSAIRISPYYAEAFCNRAIVYSKLKNFKNALADYDRALELNPKSINSLMGRGVLKMEVGNDLDGASKDLDEVIQLEPNNAQGYYNLGLAELRSGKKEKACSDFFKVKELGFSQADEMIEKNCK